MKDPKHPPLLITPVESQMVINYHLANRPTG